MVTNKKSRVRRVKCDEAKPECKRCVMFGAKCDGYGHNMSPDQLSQARSLLPRFAQEPLSLKSITPGSLFQTEREHLYFCTFRDEIVSEFCGSLEISLWKNIMLQTCHDKPFVKDGIVAISALSIAKKLEQLSSPGLVAQHTEFALRHYQQSLQNMRISLHKEIDSPRNSLIACLVVCSFESLSENYFNTLSHARCGHQMLMNWLEQYPESPERADGIVSPDPCIVEDVLLHSFRRLDRQLVAFVDLRGREVHLALQDKYTGTINRMPSTFSDIDEARWYLELIQTRSAHFQYSNSGVYCQQQEDKVQAVNKWCESQSVAVSNMFLSLAPCFDQRPSENPNILTQYNSRIGELLDWGLAFEPLYKDLHRSNFFQQEPQQPSKTRLDLNAQYLLIQWHTSKIYLSSTLCNATAIDEHLPTFQAIIDMIRPFLDHFHTQVGTHSHFSFEHGIIPCLHMVGKHCRDRRLRREAIALLRSLACCEGIWDSLILADLLERLMELEEEGVETDYIPEHARIRILDISINPHDHVASILCIRGVEQKFIYFSRSSGNDRRGVETYRPNN